MEKDTGSSEAINSAGLGKCGFAEIGGSFTVCYSWLMSLTDSVARFY